VDRPKNAGREYLEIGAAFLILVELFLVLKQFDVLPAGMAQARVVDLSRNANGRRAT
jgi:hypothetical protein